jgi:predicted nucleic acid-binding protein
LLALADTSVLVYAFDARFPEKRRRAVDLLSKGTTDGTIRLPHQAIVEFMAATTRRRGDASPLLAADEAIRVSHGLLDQFEILYPTAEIVRTALAGTVLHGLSWFDAHLWAHAEANGISELLTEDFSDDRLIGSVRVRNPFRGL